MRPSLSWLWASSAAPPGRRPATTALLPPIALYRRLLRAHRKYLSAEMRILGDEYVKAEFRAHRKVDNPAHLIGFLSEWQFYVQQIEGRDWQSQEIDLRKFNKMSEEQTQQVRKLRHAIQHGHRGSGDPD